MNSFVVIAILALATGALAAPSGETSSFIEACGIKIGVTKEQYDAFNPLKDDWTDKAKCYTECELERSGAMKDGRFTEEFKNNHKRLAEESEDTDEKMGSAVVSVCIEGIETEGCEAAYEFTGCIAAGAIGAVALGTLAAIVEAVAEAE